MLPKKYRLSSREDFSLLYSRGSYTGIYNGLAIKFLKNNIGVTRIGFPVGKNFSKKAVARNRARRILRAATSTFLGKLKPGYDIIIMLRPDYGSLELKKVIVELNKVFIKANLLM